jgi:NADH:ubiquinone oxidoreductase subunit F (NADH-binding)/(2Fe-2S) ferredoxin/Pyruvate/2-oxoacid:ferredoxin oxidoreductase delta subunit
MKPIECVAEARQHAVRALFESKFKVPVRITVGSATCENAAGSEAVYAAFEALAEAHPDAQVVISRVGCAGKCDMEPVVTVVSRGRRTAKYARMNAERAARVFEEHVLNARPVEAFFIPGPEKAMGVERVISVCGGRHCAQRGAGAVAEAFTQALRARDLAGSTQVVRSCCQGICAEGPVACLYPEGVIYKQLTPERAAEIVERHLVGGQPVAEYVWDEDRLSNRFRPVFGDVHFFGKQLRLTLRNCGVINPESLDEYLAVRGYEAAATALERMTPEDVVQAVLESGLRGRGGGGFKTGLKWKFAAAEAADCRYIICNADEGDPGAFMDRSTIEGDPHTIVEGLIIGGYAIGATQGFVYIRAEYPLAIRRLQKAIDDARAAGFLGEDIFGTGRVFDIEMRLGAGAFVCGEETALIHSIEGQRGMPRPRPPYPSVSGLWGKPTVINNVETLANIPVIILDGPEWFATIGTPKSTGTKVFALAGDVANTGLVEVPMGTTLREVVYDVGGGMKDGKAFKAVQTGGPAGGCLPASMLDTPVDYDTLAAAGSIMGSGGMIVMNEDACMVNVARFFLEFTQNESCGKCTPCREGTKRMLEILTRITEGQGRPEDIDRLLRLANTIKKTSLCGLGQAAPNPVLSTITHFRDEYEAHIDEKRCPTGACAKLVTYRIDPEACVGCGACKRACPVECITGEKKAVHTIDQDACIRCGRCFDVCKFNAVIRS